MSKTELNLINLQIGCILRFARLKQNLSQDKLGNKIDYTSIMIGRVERAEGISGWDKIFTISQFFNINFNYLFVLQDRDSLLSMVNESFSLERKLTQGKIDYYNFLKKTITTQFELLEKEKKS